MTRKKDQDKLIHQAKTRKNKRGTLSRYAGKTHRQKMDIKRKERPTLIGYSQRNPSAVVKWARSMRLFHQGKMHFSKRKLDEANQ